MKPFVGVVLGAAAIAIVLTVPPRARQVETGTSPSVVRGIMHVHTLRSDGTGTVEAVARAAADVGLAFVILTDHGDGTRVPDPPTYLHGVLVMDAVEVSATDGHVVALGMSQALYPLGGEARDVVDDVHRLGGIAIAAHPGSPKAGLEWRDWAVPFDGLEWLNADSEWRDEDVFSLLRVLMAYPIRPREALTTLLDRPAAVLQQWDTLTATRPVVGLAAADAHARIGVTSLGEPYDTRVSFPVPSYAAVFSAMSMSLEGVALSGNASADATSVLNAIRAGRVYTTVDGLATPGRLMFEATGGDRRWAMGEHIEFPGPVTLRAEVQGPPGVRLVLYRNGHIVRAVDAATLEESVSTELAAYRVEAELTGRGDAAVPWIVSNPIYRGMVSPRREEPRPPRRRADARAVPLETTQAIAVERSADSVGVVSPVEAGRGEVLFRYALGGRPSDHPYAAMVVRLESSPSPGDTIRFVGRSDKPMRVSVQLRSPGATGDDRWRRSVYLDEQPRIVEVRVADLRPVGTEPLERGLGSVDSLLFVADAVHVPLGNGGRMWLRGLELSAATQ